MNLSLRRCKPSPVFVPLFLPRFLTLQIAVSTETLQGACVVGVVNKRTETHEWMQTHLSDVQVKESAHLMKKNPFLTCPYFGTEKPTNEEPLFLFCSSVFIVRQLPQSFNNPKFYLLLMVVTARRQKILADEDRWGGRDPSAEASQPRPSASNFLCFERAPSKP